MYFDWSSFRKLGQGCGCNCNSQSNTGCNASNGRKGKNIGDFMLTFGKMQAYNAKANKLADQFADKYGFYNPNKQNGCNCASKSFDAILERKNNYWKNNPPPPPPKKCGCNCNNTAIRYNSWF